MAYDPTIPALENYIGYDIEKIRENFAELAGSRIVDHNLDVADPPTGWYVRYSSGKQECFGNVVVFEGDESSTVKTDLLYYPAPFSQPPAVMGDAGGGNWQYRVAPSATAVDTPRNLVRWRAERFDGGSWTSGSMYRLLYVAKGVWK